jgi:SAM-dependent methyltransferase
VADASIDVILSNCVINLSPDKAQVYREAFRVLKPGGRLAIADVLATAELPPNLRENVAAFSGCAAGAALIGETEALLRAAGFESVRIDPRPASREVIRGWMPGSGAEDFLVSATVEAVKQSRPGAAA